MLPTAQRVSHLFVSRVVAPRQGKHYDIMTVGQWRQSRSQLLPGFDSVFEKHGNRRISIP